MFEFRIGSLLIAIALLFVATKVYRASKGKNVPKYVGVSLAALAGCALLGTFVGDWMGQAAGWFGVVGVVAMLIAGAIFAVDILVDRTPNKPAFWAAVVLPVLLVFGVHQFDAVVNQVTDGADRVKAQIDSAGR